MSVPHLRFAVLRRFGPVDELLSSVALLLMVLIPLWEILMRPLAGSGIQNAPVLVQHLGLLLAMFGALAAERNGHLTSLVGQAIGADNSPRSIRRTFADGVAALICGILALASWRFVASGMQAPNDLAYGLPVWVVQASMPLAFVVLAFKLGARCGVGWLAKVRSAAPSTLVVARTGALP